MAKHRMPKKRRARKAMVVAAAAVGLSGGLVLGVATNTTAENLIVRLAAKSVIGAGGLGDNLGERVEAKLSHTVVPPGYTYFPLQYDSTLNLAESRDAGTILLHHAITVDHQADEKIIGVGYSAGTLAIEKERRALQALPAADAPLPSQLSFVMIANPFIPNGGVFGRFPQGIVIPGLIDFMGPGQVTRYDTDYVANEYDPYGDFPAYFNPLALVNTALGVRYAHPDEQYNAIDPSVTPHYTTTVYNPSTGSTDTYTLYLNAHLPLLGPLREVAGLVPLGTELTEPLLGAIEPLLRLFVDMAYTDRQNLDPATPTPFSLITPPAKVIEAVAGIPGALAQGAANLLSGGQSLSTLQDQSVNALAAPVSAAPEVGTQRHALASVAEPAAAVAKDPVAKDVVQKDAVQKDAVQKDAVQKDAVQKDAVQKDADQKDADQITHPTVTSDGNKVTPTTTAGAATTGNQQPVEAVPTTPTNPPAEKDDSTPTVPAANPQAPASTTVGANDATTHQATDAAAA